MIYNYSDAINVFTDASTTSVVLDGRKYNCACSGQSMTILNSLISYHSDIFFDATNSYGEIYALLIGVTMALDYNQKKFNKSKPINVYSDSEFAVLGSTLWIKDWFNRGSNHLLLVNKSQSVVSHMDLFLSIMRTVLLYDQKINILNILGHKNPNNVSDMDSFRNYFLQKNKIYYKNTSINDLQTICHYNNFVDKSTRDNLVAFVKNKDFPILADSMRPKRVPMYWYPTEEDLYRYLSLVN